MFKSFFRQKSRASSQSTEAISLEDAEGPSDEVIVAIGDIHGRADALARLLAAITPERISDRQSVSYVFLGDYIDRGSESCAVIDMLINWGQLHRSVFLMGNHEHSLMDFIEDPVGNAAWLDYGGIETLLSYNVALTPGLNNRRELYRIAEAIKYSISGQHQHFFDELTYSHLAGDYLFVHAGVYPDRPLSANDEQSFLWMREPFLSGKRLYEKIIVHGHTITKDFEPEVLPNRIGIDTGSYLNGKISALIIQGRERLFVNSIDL